MTGDKQGDLAEQRTSSEAGSSVIEYPQTVALLKRLQETFPAGVPFLPPEQLWFVIPTIGDQNNTSTLSDAESQLLRQAVEKGLHRSWSDVRVLVVEQLLNHLEVSGSHGFRIIFLGVDEAVSEGLLKDKLPKDRAITTISVKEILKDPANKRIFWDDIKALAL